MDLRKQNHKFCFTGNPIEWSPKFPEDANDPRGAMVTVTQGAATIYEGRVAPDKAINFADIAWAYVDYLPEATGGAPLECVCSAAALEARKISVSVEYDGYADGCSFIPLVGKIPARATLPGANYIERAFLYSGTNYLLLSMDRGWWFPIKETELAPMYFLRDNTEPQTIEARASDSRSIELGSVSRGVYALDFDAIRREFIEVYGILPSHISIYTGGEFSFICLITPAEIAACSQKIKYRNSLGCFAVLELNGIEKLTASAEELPEAYEVYNSASGGHEKRRDGGELTHTLTVAGVVRSANEYRKICEVARSEEVYLLCDGFALRVVPEVSEIIYPNRFVAPVDYEISFRFATPGVIEWGGADDRALPSERPRMFGDTFNDKFK